MTTEMVTQKIFTTGEVDVQNWKRTDLEAYMSAAQQLENVSVTITGGLRKRPGTTALLDVSAQASLFAVLYPFRDANGVFYIVMAVPTIFYVYSYIDGALALYATVTGTPFQQADLASIDWAQNSDTLVFSHPLYAPSRLYVASYSPAVFAWQYLNIFPYPVYDFEIINYNNFTVSLGVVGNVLTFQFTGVGADPGFNNDWINGQIVGGGASALQPLGQALIQTVAYSGGGGGTVTFTALVQIPFDTTTYSTSGAQYSVTQPAWSATLGWPAKCLFYQNRLWFANTKRLPGTVFGSQINTFLDFSVGVGSVIDAIVYSIGDSDSGGIVWLNGGKQLEIYTENYEFVAPQDQNIALTPTTFAVRQQSSFGASSNMKPITYLNDSYFVSRKGNAVINFHFEGLGLSYTSSNIGLQSSHLLTNPTRACVIRGSAESQDNFIYFKQFGNLTSFQFAAESKLAALTPVNFDTASDEIDFLVSMVTINNDLFILKAYSETEFNIEILKSQQSTTAGLIKMDGMTTVTLNANGTVTVGAIAIDYLNGLTPNLVINNQDLGESIAPVSGGAVTFNNPNGLTGSAIIGVVYPVNIAPMYTYSGNAQSNFYKDISRIFVDYYNSIDFSINGALVQYQTFTNVQAQTGMIPMTDTAVVSPVLGWNRFNTFTINQVSPFDLQIVGISYQVESHII